jgi:hypothetical protein
MDVGPFRIIIEWPNGTRLPVRLASDATGADLISLIQFATTAHSPVFLVNDSHFIHPRRELRSQRIREDSVIRVVHYRPPLENHFFSDGGLRRRGIWPERVFTEVIRISDMQFNQLETHRRTGQSYWLAEAEATEGWEATEMHATVVPPSPARVSEDPLPMCRTSSDEEEAEEVGLPGFLDGRKVQGEWQW